MRYHRPVPKPFKRGRCQACHHPGKHGWLCSCCEQYANQDYIPRSEILVFGEILEKLGVHSTRVAGASADESGSEQPLARKISSFETMLRKAGVTAKQRLILRKVFKNNQSFSDIAKTLGVTRALVAKQYHRAIKKAQSRYTNSVLVRGQCSKVPQPAARQKIDNVAVSSKFKPMPSQLYISRSQHQTSARPRCGASIFQIGRNFQYCMDCMWTCLDGQDAGDGGVK